MLKAESRRSGILWPLAWLLAAACGAALAQAPAAAPAPKAVLVLLSTGYGQPGIDNYVKGLYGTLKDQGLPYTRVHIEYLDLVKNPDAAHRQRLAELLDGKYAGATIGAIVAVQPGALSFLMKEGRAIAQTAPVLVAQARLPAGADTGGRLTLFQTPSLDFAGTLTRALELFPETRRVLLLSGSSEVEQGRLLDARRQFAPWQDRLEFEYTDGWTFDEVERRVAAQPAHTVIIAPGINRDVAGTVFVPVDTIIKVARTANAPVFPVYSVSIGQGPVGGMVSVLEDEGSQMANSVLDALRRDASQLATLQVPTARPVPLFDWRQIERWGGDASRLPPDTVFLHRPPTLWGQYRGYVLGGGLSIALLSALVVALALQNRRRLLAERSLRASQHQYRLLADNISDVLWIFNLAQQRLEYVSPSVEKLCGYSVEQTKARGLQGLISEDARAKLVSLMTERIRDHLAHAEAGTAYTDTTELSHRDGSTVWIELVTRFVRNEQGQLALLGTSRDINQRVAAEAEITQLAFYDTLTQLPNRRLLLNRAQHALARIFHQRRTG